MRMMMLAGAASLLGAGSYYIGTAGTGEYYPIAPENVAARLSAIKFGPELIMHNGVDETIALELRNRGPREVRWDLTIGGEKAGAVSVDLEPERSGTRVTVTVDAISHDAIYGGQHDAFSHDFAQIMMVEKIDSVLDGRAFDRTAVAAQLAGTIAADPQAITENQQRLQRQVEGDMLSMGGVPSTERKRSDPWQHPSPKNDPAKSAVPDWSKTHADGGWDKTSE